MKYLRTQVAVLGYGAGARMRVQIGKSTVMLDVAQAASLTNWIVLANANLYMRSRQKDEESAFNLAEELAEVK